MMSLLVAALSQVKMHGDTDGSLCMFSRQFKYDFALIWIHLGVSLRLQTFYKRVKAIGAMSEDVKVYSIHAVREGFIQH